MTHTKRTRGRHLSLADLTADPHNANRGTDRGRDALARSLREYGAGRAVLIDRRGRVIAGNKTVEQARALNLPLRVVHTDGSFLIAVQRNDLDLLHAGRDPRAAWGSRPPETMFTGSSAARLHPSGTVSTIRRSAPDDAMDVHIDQTREVRVPRVRAADMACERYLQVTRHSPN